VKRGEAVAGQLRLENSLQTPNNITAVAYAGFEIYLKYFWSFCRIKFYVPTLSIEKKTMKISKKTRTKKGLYATRKSAQRFGTSRDKQKHRPCYANEAPEAQKTQEEGRVSHGVAYIYWDDAITRPRMTRHVDVMQSCVSSK